MPTRRFAPAEIIGKLGKTEVVLSQDRSVGKVARSLAISGRTQSRPAQIA